MIQSSASWVESSACRADVRHITFQSMFRFLPRALVVFAAVVPALTAAAPSAAQGQVSSQWEAFSELVLGTWESEDSRHVIEWGLGERFIRTRSYFPDGESWILVSEGMWWWDSHVEAIKGVAFAVSMPVDRFDYTTRVEGSTVIHELSASGEMGGEMREIWEMAEDAYDWRLIQPGPDGDTPLMGGRYRRVR